MQMVVGSSSYTLIDVNCSIVIKEVVCLWRPSGEIQLAASVSPYKARLSKALY